MDMQHVDQKVSEQFEHFRRELPRLQAGAHRGEWVLFLDGPQGYFSTEDEAHDEGVERFGPEAGFVVARLEPLEPVLLNAALAYFPAG